MSEEKQLYNVDEARAAIEADQRARVEATWADIDRALKARGCVLFAQPRITDDGRVIADVKIRAL